MPRPLKAPPGDFGEDLAFRVTGGIDDPRLGGRWPEQVRYAGRCLEREGFRSRDRRRKAEFLNSALGQNILALATWDRDRGGGMYLPSREHWPERGPFIGIPWNLHRGEGRAIVLGGAPYPDEVGVELPPLESYERELLRRFFQAYPRSRPTGKRGRKSGFHPALHPSPEPWMESNLERSYNSFRRSLRPYRVARRRGRGKEEREALRAVLREMGLAGESLEEWLGMLGERGQPQDEFCAIMAEVTNVSAKVVRHRLREQRRDTDRKRAKTVRGTLEFLCRRDWRQLCAERGIDCTPDPTETVVDRLVEGRSGEDLMARWESLKGQATAALEAVIAGRDRPARR